MVFNPSYVLILLITIGIDYIAGLIIESSGGIKRKFWLILSLLSNIGILIFFKYSDFFISNINLIFQEPNHFQLLNILLPIGLSFHTFQAMSYTIEVYRGNQKAEKHLGVYALYVMFYPQLVAGPIERPQNILPQLHKKHPFDTQNIIDGMKLMIWGLFKKIVIADRLSALVDYVYATPNEMPAYSLIIAMVFFSFQIYCDFSGYSDMAIGAAKTLGIDLMKNFDTPYFSKSIREFWGRWHISLSTWFRDYLYIPLGGNRVNIIKFIRNVLLVFFISGFWHGAEWKFVLWGGLYGLILIIETYIKNKVVTPSIPSYIKILITFITVTLIWVLFRANNLEHAFNIYMSLLKNWHIENKFIGMNFNELIFSISIIGFMLWFEHNKNLIRIKNKLFQFSLYTLLILFCYLFGIFNYSSFIYFQF